MGSVTPEAEKDDPELEDSSIIDKNPPGQSVQLKSWNLVRQDKQQCSLVSNNGKWLQIVKAGPKGSISRATSFFHNKIPRHLVSLDEKYLRRCLDLINISAFKSASYRLSMDSLVISKENVARLTFDLPLVDDSRSLMFSSAVTGCKRITHLPGKPLDGDDTNSGTRRDEIDNSEKVLDLQFQSYEYRNTAKKAVSFSSTNSISSSSSTSEQSSSFWSPPGSTVFQGTLQFTMKDNKMPYFVFSLDDQKEIYVASLSTSSVASGFDRSSRDYSYLIHLKKDRGSEPQHLVGKLKVSTLFSDSLAIGKIVERQFVLFSNGGNPLLPNDVGKNRGLTKKVVDMIKSSARASRFSRTSSIADFSSWEPFQEPDHELEHLLDIDELPPNLETLAVIVREEVPEEDYEEEKVGGWGMKFLKRTSLIRTEKSERSTSIDVVIPSGIHGGRRLRKGGGPSSLIERWKSGGSCDCSGWDLGCSLTVFNGHARKDLNEGHCNLFELFAGVIFEIHLQFPQSCIGWVNKNSGQEFGSFQIMSHLKFEVEMGREDTGSIGNMISRKKLTLSYLNLTRDLRNFPFSLVPIRELKAWPIRGCIPI